jgi:predicted nucleic acid-binding Zn ribbon protein
LKTAGSVLSSVFKNLGVEEKIKLESLKRQWNDIFGEPLSLHTFPADIKDGELLINVDSPVWLQQLKFFKQEILKKLRAYAVGEIKFRHGMVYQSRFRKDSEQQPQANRHLSDSEITWIDSTVSSIDDADLKENIKKAIKKSLTHNP